MALVDTNIILRYLLNDDSKRSPVAEKIMQDEQVFIITQVIAECIYVLEKIYKAKRSDISSSIKQIISMRNVEVESKEVNLMAVNKYGASKLDFVDLLLWANNKLYGFEVKTLDKPLEKMLKEM
jgi:predicted nucleic-acid-binding protein